MDSKIKDKTIILFGCTGILGSEFLEFLYSRGAKLILADLKSQKFKQYEKKYPAANFYKCDVTKEKDIKKLKSKILKTNKNIDAIIYNVGYTSRFSSLKNKAFPDYINYSLRDWHLSIDTNLTGAFLVSKYLINFLAKKKGSLIFISSIYGLMAPDKRIYKSQKFKTMAGYSASKAGLQGLSKWLATNFADKKIRVNTIIPGGIKANQNKKFIKNYSSRVPLKRMGKREDINGILEYLVSDNSSYVTGQEFVVDGGLSTW